MVNSRGKAVKEVSVNMYNEIAEFWSAKEDYDFLKTRDVEGYLSAEKRMKESVKRLFELGMSHGLPVPKLDEVQIKSN